MLYCVPYVVLCCIIDKSMLCERPGWLTMGSKGSLGNITNIDGCYLVSRYIADINKTLGIFFSLLKRKIINTIQTLIKLSNKVFANYLEIHTFTNILHNFMFLTFHLHIWLLSRIFREPVK